MTARASKLIPALLVVVSLAIACGTSESPPPSNVVVSDDASEPAANEPSAVVPDGVPKIASDAAVHDFGAIKATDSVEHVFGIRNTGSADLKIEKVQPT